MKFNTLFTVALFFFVFSVSTFFPHAYVQAQDVNLTDETASSSDNTSLENLKNMAIELKYYDEILTSSVLSYAFSGDEKWIDRYNEYEPKLGLLIEKTLTYKQEEDEGLILQLNQINDVLVGLEIKAIKSVQENNRQAAMSIINSDEYHQHKMDYMKSLLGYIDKVELRISAQNRLAMRTNDLDLTEEEWEWIQNNKITIGIEFWPPILFMQDDKLPGGLSGEILIQIINKFDLDVEYVTGTWDEVLALFKQGKLDVLPDAYMIEERKKYGNYSTPYFMVRELFYVKDSSTRFQANRDLSDANIAVSAGYTTIDKLKSIYPNINIIETSGIAESIDKVINGKVDALLDAQIVVDDWLRQKSIRDLRVIDEDVIYPPSLHLLSHKNKKILQSILQKGLDSIKASDLMNSNNDWLTSRNQAIGNENKSFDFEYIMWFVAGAVVVLFCVGSLVSSLVLKVGEDELALKFGSKRFKNVVLAGLVTLSGLLIVISVIVINYAEKEQYESVDYSLDTLLATTHQRLGSWIQYELDHIEAEAKSDELMELVEQLLVIPEDVTTLIQSPLQSQIRKYFLEREGDYESTGFFIISPNKVSLSSLRDNNIGTENLINKVRPGLLQKVLDGESVFIPPLQSEVKINGEINPTMFFAAPIVNNEGKVIAIVTKRINFDGVFSTILSAGFIGRSGETYALDESGMLLSNVRFEDDLRKIGLIDKGERASLNIRISDPGVNLLNVKEKVKQDENWPLTLMSSHISKKQTDSNFEGYRDYRGVEVIGSWLWDESLNMGLVAEVDIKESLAFLNLLKYTIWSILFISLLLVFGGTLFTLKVGTRATGALARSHSELEGLVNDRTQELELSMQRTQTIIDNASDGIVMVNEQGIIQSFSPSAEHIFEYQADEVIGANIELLMNHSFQEQFIEKSLNQQSKQSSFELIGCKKSKELIDIEVAVGEAKVGEELLFIGMVRDTTLRKKAERELKKAMRQAEEASLSLEDRIRFQQLLMDSVPIPLFHKDKEGRFQGFNKAYEEVFNVKSEDLIGLKVTELTYLTEEDRKKYQAEDEMVIAEQKNLRKEIKLPFADGQLHDTLYWVTGFSDRNNEPAGLVGNFIDITAEKENARHLELALKKADEATRAKSDFLANMSHEIRTPMNAIIGMSYLALQTNLNRKQEDYVNKIHSSADALLGIINDILDFSKIEAGKLELESVPFNLNESIDHLVQIISHKSQQKSLELLIDLAPGLPLDLIGDSLRLGQILINLTNNAIKFTDKGEIIVKARKLAQGKDNVTIEFSVCDTGIGMTEDQLGRLFKSFSQADASTTRKYGGTGLGLTISKTLTELMQGEIWVESTYGKGSEFYFTATFGLADENSTGRKLATSSLVDLPVLIVDDSLAAREILFNLCKSLNFKPDVAASGAEAIEKLVLAEKNNNPFKVVLADWKMPHMDGVTLGERVMNDGILEQVPQYVIVTAYDRDDMLKEALHINLASSITKPVSASTLLDTIIKIMGEGHEPDNKVSSSLLDTSFAQSIVGAKILLVEDNEINQQIAIELLEMAGLQVSVAGNGEIAVEAIKNGEFDGVLMDIQMPVMDGYTATQEIRKDAKNAKLPIIAMTANAMSGDKEKCIAAGMNDHIAKPIDPQDVYKKLAQWIAPTGNDPAQIQRPTQNFEESELPHLPGFDVTSALARMGGNVNAYRNTLKKVAKTEADAVDRIREAVEAEDFKSAEIIAHTVKGVSANVGANFVMPSAEKLEKTLNARVEKGEALNAESFENLILTCEVKLAQMVSVIEEDNQSSQAQDNQKDFDLDAVNTLLQDLKNKIENFDSVASETLEQILSYLSKAKLTNTAMQLANALEVYDFDKAEVLMAEFEKDIMQYVESVKPLDDEALVQKLNVVEQKIMNFDSTVVDAVDEILDSNISEPLLSKLEQIRETLSEYDFDSGETQLAEIKSYILNRTH